MRTKEATKQLDEFESQVKNLTLDRMNEAPQLEVEPQTKLSSKELEKNGDLYLKPSRWISDGQKFNSDFQKDWEFAKEYVQFIAEHKESPGETIELWTHPFGGKGAEFWQVPANKPVWGPRYLAEQLRKCTYHRLRMDESRPRETTHAGTMFGAMVVDNIVSRITAEPVYSKKSVFMGAAA
jgi:hypothetical protein